MLPGFTCIFPFYPIRFSEATIFVVIPLLIVVLGAMIGYCVYRKKKKVGVLYRFKNSNIPNIRNSRCACIGN